MTPTFLLYIVPIFFWGTSWYIITWQLGTVPVTFSVALRFLIASLLLFGFCYVKGEKMKLKWNDHLFIFLQGLCLFGLNYLIFYIAQQYVTSGIVALIFSTIMFFNILNSNFLLRHRFEFKTTFLAFWGLSGIILVFNSELKQLGADENRLYGLVLCLIATYIASLGNILSSFNQSKKKSVLITNTYGMLYGSLIIFVAFIFSGEKMAFDFSLRYIFSLFYLSIGASILAFGCYLSLIGRIGPSKAAYIFFITPIIALGISTVVEGYVWNVEGIFGAVIILTGCLMLLLTKKEAKKSQ